MAIVRFDPFRGFESLARRMSSFMEDFDKGLGFNLEFGNFAPRVDIAEDEKNLYIHAELPGLKKEDVKVSINEDRVLTIKGEKKRDEKFEDKSEDKCFIRVERSFGSFVRSFMLPDNIKTENVNAKFENGVLELTLEKVEPEKPKEIPVEIK